MDDHDMQRQPFSRASERARIPADSWRVCSHIFVEGRRIRALLHELRDAVATELDPTPRAALALYLETLERAASLGDVAADALVARHTRID